MPDILTYFKGAGQAVQLLKDLSGKGKTGEEILSALHESGYEISKEVTHLTLNYINKAIIPSTEILEKLEFNVIPNIASIPLSLTKTLRNFAYKVHLTGESANSGQLQDQYMTISTNSLLTKEQAIDAANSILGNGSRYDGLINATGELESISQNAAGLTAPEAILPGPPPVGITNDDLIRNALKENRDYLQRVAQGPVIPIVYGSSGVNYVTKIATSLDQFVSIYSK